IRLIGTHDAEQTVTLDTVNNIVVKESDIDLYAILALLHADLVNWFVYAVVYNKAIRTMHFDQYFLDKILLPAGFERVQSRLARLAKAALDLARSGAELGRCEDIQQELDEEVSRAYGL